MLEINKRKIECSIFSAREKFIQELNHDIWREDLTPGELMNKARQLFAEADLLFTCPKYNRENISCKMCKAISELRKSRAVHMLGSDMKSYQGVIYEPSRVISFK